MSDETGKLLAQAESDTQGQEDDSDDVRMLRVARRGFDQATKLPTELVAELARHQALSQETWIKARAENDWAAFQPALEKMLELTRQKAEHLGYKEHIYDALIDLYEPGATQAVVAAMFADMKPHLVELTSSIASKPQVGRQPDSWRVPD